MGKFPPLAGPVPTCDGIAGKRGEIEFVAGYSETGSFVRTSGIARLSRRANRIIQCGGVGPAYDVQHALLECNPL